MTANNNPTNPALTVSNVQATAATMTGFQVDWSTNVAADSSVDYGKTSSYGSSTAVSSAMVTSHQVTLTGLTPGTTYHFRVKSNDGKGNASSGDTTFATANDTTPPTVSITTPAANATLAGAITVTASASDNVAVASVQFKVDSANTGSADTSAPYSYLLDTTTLSNGNHVLTAVATDTSGNSATSAGVAVKVNNVASTTPSINSLSPTSGVVGTSVTIAGANFGTTQGTGTVTFNGAAATPTSWSATSIMAKVPTGATSGSVVVTVGGVASNGVSFTVTTAATPSISSLNPTSGLVGTSVTIAGANFGASQGSSTVKFNGTTATPTSWSATSIAAPVPSGATTGNVVVTVGGTASNGVSFTVQADTTPPSVPTGLTATAVSSSQINLTWTASTDNVGVTGYNIFRGGTKIGTAPNTTYQDSGLAASTSYSYTVSAFDAAGNTSAQSAAASATTQAASSGGLPNTLGWYQIPNTTISPLCPTYPEIQGNSGCAAVVAAWGSSLADTSRNRLIIWGGGHTDYYGNEVFALDLNANPIKMVLVKDSTHGTNVTGSGSCPENYLDGSMSSRHDYGGMQYLPNQDLYFQFSGSKAFCGSFSNSVWTFNPKTLAWATYSVPSSHPDPGTNGSTAATAYDPVTDEVYDYDQNSGTFWAYKQTTNTWTLLNSGFGGGVCSGTSTTAVIDPVRRLFMCGSNGWLAQISLNAPYTGKRVTGTNCTVISGHGVAMEYDPLNKDIVMWNGGNTVYNYNPDTDSCTAATYSGGPTGASAGQFNKFRFFPAFGVFIAVVDTNQDAYALRLSPVSGGGSGPNISAVGVNSITTTGAIVTWTTDVGATSQVEYGTTTSYGSMTTLDSTLLTAHSVILTGLTVNTVYHYRVHSKNSGGVESISADAVFQTSSVVDTTPPTISITAPANGASVSGTVTVSANASDNVGVTSVQFLLDGTNLGSALAASPYTVSWNTATTTNGAHVLTATASDAAGNVGNAVAVNVTVSNSTSTALQDFQNRCAQSGVIVCQGFDDPAVFTPAKYPASGLYPAADGVIRAVQDTTITASGAGSLKFTVPSTGQANSTGFWRQLFQSSQSAGPSTATMFGQNSTIYVQFRQRFSAAYLSNNWIANDGSKTYWKQDIISNDNSTCGNIEITTVDWEQKGFPTMYSECGQYGFETNLNNGDYLLEQGDTSSTGYNCHYQAANNGPNSCFLYPANTWVTFYYKISIGTWKVANSSVQAWVAVGGGPYVEFINEINQTLYEDTTPGADYDMVTLLTYMTNRNSSISAGPPADTWYDELIVSSQAIAAPNN